jgi:hypothetical protein
LISAMAPMCSRHARFSILSGSDCFWSRIEADRSSLDAHETIRIVEDYKPLDIESATMAVALCRGIRERYPDWRFLLDGDGGDENLKDYPIEQNPELTIRSVINNPMLYQEGWGVGKIKHSLTYSGGLSRSYARTYAPAHHFGFAGLSPYTRPSVIAIAEAIPFVQLTDYSVDKLYELKGEIVARGIAAVTGIENAGLSEAALSARRDSGRRIAPQPSFPGSRVPQAILVSVSVKVFLGPQISYGPERSRTEWILAQRPQRTELHPEKPYAFFVEEERSATGEVVPVATIFLTNRECPWHCVMCDLWKNTLTRHTAAPGSIPRQIAYALERLPPARQVKLYNSGSFFDVQAIPPEDYPAIAALVGAFRKNDR